jgi:hypothetical protein
MKKNQIIYWVTTGLVGLMMAFSASQYFTNPQMMEAFKHLGFPDYFRVELGALKFIGALVLLVPQVPARIKEWAYAGFGIVLISAAYSHFSIGDAMSAVVTPLVVFGVLCVSYVYFHKRK